MVGTPAPVRAVSVPGLLLLVDDSPLDAELTIEALSSIDLGNAVVHVGNGIEALEYLRREGRHVGRTSPQPAVILLDCSMPKMGGITLLRELKLDPELKWIPVVMLTASRESEDLAQSYALGVNAFVAKPVEYDPFIATIRGIARFWIGLNATPETLGRTSGAKEQRTGGLLVER